jgi:hypothetical protein
MDSSLQKDDLKKFCSSFRASRKRGSPENNLQDLMEKSQGIFVNFCEHRIASEKSRGPWGSLPSTSTFTSWIEVFADLSEDNVGDVFLSFYRENTDISFLFHSPLEPRRIGVFSDVNGCNSVLDLAEKRDQ